MKREKARLDELRQMPYAEYMLTPEWQETRKVALKRVGKRCQVCRGTEANLEVYHTSLENVGCEQEGDVLALCENCSDLVAKTVMRDTNVTGDEEEKQTAPDFSLTRKSLVFVPSALAGIGLPALLHAPLPAELFGLGAAFYLAFKSPKIYAEIRGKLPTPLVEWLDGAAERKQERHSRGEWSNWDRFLGRHMRGPVPVLPEADEMLIESLEDREIASQQDILNLGPTLKPHADQLLSGRKVILGVSGSGKTNTMNVYIEEIGGLKPAPAIILFDTDDENRAICSKKHWPNPVWMDKEQGLTKNTAFEVAQTILEQRYQCVVNLQSYDDEEAAWIMINMIKSVKAWQEAREIRIPCEIVLDEASIWLPQNARESSLSSVMVDDPDPQDDEDSKKISLLALLQRAYFRTVVRRGRRRGMGFTLASQRIAEIDKRALQGSWTFLMRQTQPADWREYKKFGISSEEAMGLLDGEAYVFPPGGAREKHRLRVSNSPHGGVTPGMKALRGAVREQTTPRPTEAAPDSDISPESPTASLTSIKTIYHTHEGSDQASRTRAREMRLRGATSTGTHPRLRVVRPDGAGRNGTQRDMLGEGHEGQNRDAHARPKKSSDADFSPNLTRDAGIPKQGRDEPVASVPPRPAASCFVPQGDQKLLPADRWEELYYWYGKVGSVRGALEKMGITNSRFVHHASFLLEQRGLKIRKA